MINSIRKSLFRNASPTSPVREAERFAVECDHSVGSLVTALLGLSRPAAVGLFVITTLVWKAIQGMLGRRTRTHVAEEVFKGAQPIIGHCYASAAVPLKSVSIWIEAAIPGLYPRSIFRGHSLTGCVSMLSGANPGKLALQTSAATTPPVSQRLAGDSADNSTLAEASPCSMVNLPIAHVAGGLLKNRPVGESFAGYINEVTSTHGAPPVVFLSWCARRLDQEIQRRELPYAAICRV